MPTDTDDLTSAEQRVREQSVYTEIAAERVRQDAKWGPVRRQPDVDPVLAVREGNWAQRIAEEHEIPTETRAKFLCQTAEKRGECSFTHIVVEELCEAVAKYRDPTAMRVELVQLAASVVKWIEAVDLAAAQPSAPTEPPPKRDIWTLAEEAQREVDAWPAWKRRAADQALVTPPATTTEEPDATEGPVMIAGYDVRPKCLACGKKWWPPEGVDAREVPCPACRKRESMHAVGVGTPAAPTVEPPEPSDAAIRDALWKSVERDDFIGSGPPEPDEDRTKPPPSYEVFSVDEDEPPTGPPVWGWIVNRESPADHGEWFGTAAEAVADAWHDYDKFTAPLRARAETAERERDEASERAAAAGRRVAELEQRLEQHVPCRACGYAHASDPSRDSEPPIVRGALDAQEAAEKALGKLRKEYDALEAASTEACKHLLGLLERCERALEFVRSGYSITPAWCEVLTNIRTALHQKGGQQP